MNQCGVSVLREAAGAGLCATPQNEEDLVPALSVHAAEEERLFLFSSLLALPPTPPLPVSPNLDLPRPPPRTAAGMLKYP